MTFDTICDSELNPLVQMTLLALGETRMQSNIHGSNVLTLIS